MLASIENHYIEKSIAVMSPYSFKNQFAKAKYAKRKEEYVRTGFRDIPGSDIRREYAIPYSFVEDAMHYDLEQCIQALNKPKLFIAGLQDNIIDVDTVQQGYSIACEPKKYREVDIGHNYRYNYEIIEEVQKKVELFISNY
jgi:hypothetical protein